MRRAMRIVGFRELRERLGLTQEYVAERMEVDVKTVQRAESEGVSWPVARRAARYLGEVIVQTEDGFFQITHIPATGPGRTPTLEDVRLAVGVLRRALGRDPVALQNLGYVCAEAAADGAASDRVFNRLRRFIGWIFSTREVEPAEAALVKKCILDPLAPAVVGLDAALREQPELVQDAFREVAS